MNGQNPSEVDEKDTLSKLWSNKLQDIVLEMLVNFLIRYKSLAPIAFQTPLCLPCVNSGDRKKSSMLLMLQVQLLRGFKVDFEGSIERSINEIWKVKEHYLSVLPYLILFMNLRLLDAKNTCK